MRTMTLAVMLVAVSSAANAAAPPTKAEMQALMVPGKQVFVMDYYGPSGRRTLREEIVVSKGAAKALNGTDFEVEGKRIRLTGIKACSTDRLVADGFEKTPCKEAAVDMLGDMVTKPLVVLCRASETSRSAQTVPATCYAFLYFPGSLISVDDIADSLVGMGRATRAKR